MMTYMLYSHLSMSELYKESVLYRGLRCKPKKAAPFEETIEGNPCCICGNRNYAGLQD